MIRVGIDILDGTFEAEFDYRLLSRKGEEPIRYEILPDHVHICRPGEIRSDSEIYTPLWLRDLVAAFLMDSGDANLAIARNEGLDIS